MTAHLLAISIGPVQDFIAQARRTRDLWAGSWTLSELARAAAKACREGGARLIFPHPDFDSNDAIANKLLAEIQDGTPPSQVARAARKAIRVRWEELASQARRDAAGAIAAGSDDAWKEQIDTAVDFTAAWTALEGDYKGARDECERALAARKLLREFDQWKHVRGGLPKSSLDGARETVLVSADARAAGAAAKVCRDFRIKRNEQLDAVGVVKRTLQPPNAFLPIPNIALRPWIERANELPSMTALVNACGEHPEEVARVDGDAFRFDASIFLEQRWSGSEPTDAGAPCTRTFGERYVRSVLASMAPPFTYVACLVGDGDRMGARIDELQTANEHRTFSRSLAEFAKAAATIVRERGGALVYAGGDDVLAFLPVLTAVDCATDLSAQFAQRVAGGTLSVGIGIGHLLSAMGDLVELGRRAERLAKESRNALGIIFDKRSGGELSIRLDWNVSPGRRIDRARELIRNALISSQKVYEIRDVLRRFPVPSAANCGDWLGVLKGEVTRALSRIQLADAEVRTALRLDDALLPLGVAADYERTHALVRDWVNLMLLARSFEDARPTVRRS